MTNLVMAVLAAATIAACGSSDPAGPDAGGPCVPPPAGSAPTYSQLYTKYFAPGTQGHCANDGCHGGTNFNIWLCGGDKDTCYHGMSTMTRLLIDTSNPQASQIGDPRNSPLIWINANGFMPADALTPFPEGRDAIQAWVAACAQND